MECYKGICLDNLKNDKMPTKSEMFLELAKF